MTIEEIKTLIKYYGEMKLGIEQAELDVKEAKKKMDSYKQKILKYLMDTGQRNIEFPDVGRVSLVSKPRWSLPKSLEGRKKFFAHIIKSRGIDNLWLDLMMDPNKINTIFNEDIETMSDVDKAKYTPPGLEPAFVTNTIMYTKPKK